MLGGLGAFFAKLGTGAAGLTKKGLHGLQGLNAGADDSAGMMRTPSFLFKAGEGLPIPKTSSGLPDIDPLRGPIALPEARPVMAAPMVPASSTTPALNYTAPPKLVLPSRVGPIETAPALANTQVDERPVMRRNAKDGVGAEWRQRLEEMRNGTPQEIVHRDPYGQDRYDYATNGGTEDPTRRGWKQVLKSMGAGALIGGKSGGLGGMIGGAISGGVGGAIDPAAGREMQFDTFRLPQIQQREEQRVNRQTEIARLGEILSRSGENQAQAEAHRAGIFREDAKAKNEQVNKDRDFDTEQGYKAKLAAKLEAETSAILYKLKVDKQMNPYKAAELEAAAKLKVLDMQKRSLEIDLAAATLPAEIAQAGAKLDLVKEQIAAARAQTGYTNQRAQGQWQENNAVTQDEINDLMRQNNASEADVKRYLREQGRTIKEPR